jgi:glyoxylase-like metal-dependent hydrolase (beta-lactamase superfamily II)
VGALELPIAERWFDATEIEAGVVAIVEPHMHLWMRSNTWLVRGRDADLLVDTGNGVAPIAPVVERLRSDPARPLLVVATHGHSDHIGGLHEFERRLAHAVEAPDIERVRDVVSLIPAELSQDYQDSLTLEGTLPLPEAFVDAVPEAGYALAAYAVPDTPLTGTLTEGDPLDLGDRTFAVLHLPGHTHGSIGLWDEASGTLFSGDTVYAEDDLLDDLPTSSIPDYLVTMRRLRELPVRIVHGGHDPSFGRERLIERCEEYLHRRGGA